MIKYYKMTGSGNDFIVIDNFDKAIEPQFIQEITRKVCVRGLSIGADGVIIIEPDDECDFKWHFYNADGSIANMCGNGARCAARFAYTMKRADKNMSFMTGAGIIKAEIKDGVNVNVQLTRPKDMKLDILIGKYGVDKANYIYTGTQHLVVFTDDVDGVDVVGIGCNIRNMGDLFPQGVNVNFVQQVGSGLKIRTYEKGVEDETLACGTGSAAAAIVAHAKGLTEFPVKILTKGNIDLKISKTGEDIFLEGEARILSESVMTQEAYRY